MELTPRATVDFETRSACSLRNSGVWRYSLHPTTQVLCLAYRLPYWEAGRTELWHPAFPILGIQESERGDDLEELFTWIDEGGLVEAHNVWFEYSIWLNILASRHKFPSIASTQWRCSAAKASALSLPRALDDALNAMVAGIASRLMGMDMPVVGKDKEGALVMRKVSKPRKPRKKELEIAARHKLKPRMYWHESKVLYKRLWAYCRQDVLAEETLSEYLPDLSDAETQVFQMDRVINHRGFQLDMEAVDAALRLIAREEKLLNKELATITDGKVKKATQRVQVIKWLATQGCHLDNTQAETIADLLTQNVVEMFGQPVFRVLTLMKELGRSSTAKYAKMRDWADTDGRVRGGLLYHGASTGRWSGAGVQPHNFVRGNVDDIEGLWRTLKTGSRREIASFPDKDGKPVGSVMDALANALRGAIVARVGTQLFVADYSGIEARVLLWLAGDEDGLNIFRSGRDIYCEMAGTIYGRPITKADKTERQVGKAAILGLGYQMGWSKFKDTAAKAGSVLTEEFAQHVVDAFRKKFWRTKDMWSDQEAAAIQAVKHPGKQVWAGKIRWKMEDRFLYCILPSGRRLGYPDPEIRQRMTPWGEEKLSLTYMGINQLNRSWQRQFSYGGMLVENIVQAVARDLMAEAMLRIERTDKYQVVLTVHDEILAESDCGEIKEFEQLMAAIPDWARGCPVTVEGFCAARYRK